MVEKPESEKCLVVSERIVVGYTELGNRAAASQGNTSAWRDDRRPWLQA